MTYSEITCFLVALYLAFLLGFIFGKKSISNKTCKHLRLRHDVVGKHRLISKCLDCGFFWD